MSKPKPPPMSTLRFIFIAAVLMLLADTYLFGGKRGYIEEARRDYYATHDVIPGEAEGSQIPPLATLGRDDHEGAKPVRVEPGMGRAYFEAPMDVEKMEEAMANPSASSHPEPDPHNVIPSEAEKSKILPRATLGRDDKDAENAVQDDKKRDGPAKIAIIIDDLGMDLKRSRAAIDLPAPVTMAFLPYGTKTKDYAVIAKEKGHSLIIHAPMEAMDGKLNIGPGGLRADMDAATFEKSFDVMLKSFEGYGGVNNHMGSRLTQDEGAMKRLMTLLKVHGLFFVDSKTINHSVAAEEARRAGVPYAERDVFLDHVDSRAFVDHALAQLERQALKDGSAIAIGHPKDTTIAGLKAWIPTLKEKGIKLVPVSELLVRPAMSSRPEPTGEVEGYHSIEQKPDPSTSLGMTAEKNVTGAAPASSGSLPARPAPPPQLPAIY